MGSFSIWHWLIVLAVVLLLFGRGKIPELMGDVAKGIKSFKKGMADQDEDEVNTAKTIDNNPDVPASPVNPPVSRAKKTSKS
ncbi:twin-arginine translocase TatA/TatE family subunit [Phyllobacterium salinisoli]|uniref:Sec-independent protein translocase protein TatA n=1 Tax=Phyllobacterium salinisoli TaxID=1899321 RepID=A0A368K579_9HYPH|nr:twin-arginine translocase TatA/TatE family subunit [Phyllobacterium salinisoli]RCS24547.1 twin-arginine translocase TatA/TatE family subunit [Phyllobacterium salinisoli]